MQLDPRLKEQFLSLPESIQEIITESNWQEKVRLITEKNKIRIDQGAIVEHEVFLVMLGFDEPENFVKNLIKEAGLDISVAENIRKDVAVEIFSKIKSALVEKTSGPTTLEPYEGTKESAPKNDEEEIESRDEIMSQIEADDEYVDLPGDGREPVTETEIAAPTPTEITQPAETEIALTADSAQTQEQMQAQTETLAKEPQMQSAPAPRQNIVAENLEKPSVSAPERKVDPYREPIE